MAENPVIRNFDRAVRAQATPTAGELGAMYQAPAYTGPRANAQTAGRYMSLDDVVVRLGAMLAVILAAGALSWTVVPDTQWQTVLIIGLMGGLGLGLYMSFKMVANAPLALTYAACQGLLLGAISRAFENMYPGIVIQALTGTVMVAAAMLFVYKIGAVRVTPKFTRIVVAASMGVFGLMLVNLIAYLVHPGGLGLRNGGALAVIFSLVCIVLAAANLVVDFDMIERGIRTGAPAKFAWYCAFGITVTLVWLYIEILRLLGNLRD